MEENKIEVEDINQEYRDLEERRKQMEAEREQLDLDEEAEIETFINENKKFNEMLKNSNFKTIDYAGKEDEDGD